MRSLLLFILTALLGNNVLAQALRQYWTSYIYLARVQLGDCSFVQRVVVQQ